MNGARPPGRGVSAEITGRVSRLAWLLDESIRLPGGFRIGWDGIIGLVPGLGDLIGVSASSYIIYLAAQGGVGKVILLRMASNVFLETIIGSIPIFGDLFDFIFKANSRNLQLLQRYAAEPSHVRRVSLLWVIVFLLVVLALLVGSVVLVLQVIQWLLASA